MNHGSLFSGIGGFDLAAEWMGWNNIFHCEIESFPRKILNYYFPNAITYEDIKQTDFSIHRGQIDILTGGFPCQPYSAAGQRKGKEDERHLWPEMLRVIREIQPRWVVGENVLGLVNWSEGLVFEEVQLDLEAEGYEVQAFILPASAKNAPHRRDRVWFVAYSNERDDGRAARKDERDSGTERVQERDTVRQFVESGEVQRNAPDSNKERLHTSPANRELERERFRGLHQQGEHWKDFPTQSPIRLRDDGISTELDGITFSKWRRESIKGYGNAIVPQVVYEIFKTIEEWERMYLDRNNQH
jgi:DNA (cytosine-5)-methyltransferase 1